MVEDNFAKDENKDFSQRITEIKNKVQKLANQYGNSLRFISGEQEAEYFNTWADYWRYVIGVNVIPADTRNKRPRVEWRQYQNTPISKEQHESWKLQNAFKNGMAIIAGNVWHNAAKKGLYLILVDLDNQKAIDEFCTKNGVMTPLSELAKSLIVEQHKDQPDKAHIIFYATHPFPKKSSDVVVLSSKLDSNDIAAIEVKGAGEHGLLFCTPSPHKNGHNYEIIEGGTLEPLTVDKLESHTENICSKHGLAYLNGNENRRNGKKVPIEDLFKDDTKIYEGHNRHEALLRVMESLIKRNTGILSLERLKGLAYQWNLEHCLPPLDEKECEGQWNDALKFLQTKNQEKENSKDNENEFDLVKTASEVIMKAHRFLTVEETKEMWHYKNGVYVLGAEILIEKEAEKTFGYDLANKHLAEIKGHIMRRTYHKREELDADINIINLKNGLYNIENDVLIEHTPNYLSINQKSVVYVKGAKPKRFGKFLQEVLYPRDIRTAVDALAYTFHRDYDMEAIFILYGYGANGKTVFTSFVSALLGINNVSNVPLTEMLSNRFALSDFENKDVNIDNELSHATIKEAAVLKRLTGGSRQRIRIERKNQKAYDIALHAKLFFNANKMPDSDDTSDAYNRRVIVISFPNRFDGIKEDKQLISKLIAGEEISGVFNILMTALRRIRHNRALYINEKTMEEKRAKYERTVNPIKSFKEEVIAEDSTESDEVTKEELYRAYERFCKRYSLPIEKKEMFGRILKNEFRFQDKRKSTGERKTCWVGVRLAGEYILDVKQHTII